MGNIRVFGRKGYALESYVVWHQLFIYHGLLEYHTSMSKDWFKATDE